jgi:hypothetical protein
MGAIYLECIVASYLFGAEGDSASEKCVSTDNPDGCIQNMDTTETNCGDDENIYLPVPCEIAERFESQMRKQGLSAWRDRGGITGYDVFIFTPDDDQMAIQKLKADFSLN